MDKERFYDKGFAEAEEREGKTLTEVHRGEVWYYSFNGSAVGSEQDGGIKGRPCVIVSNEKNNLFSTTVTIIPMTSKDKKPMPTHVYIDIGMVYGTALCEQVTTISKDRLTRYCGEVDYTTLKEIEKGLSVQLGIDTKTAVETPVKPAEQPVKAVELAPVVVDNSIEIKALETERDVYKKMYEDLLSKMLSK